MICPNSICPLERNARAIQSYIDAHKKIHWEGTMIETMTCDICGKNRTWKQETRSGETREVVVSVME